MDDLVILDSGPLGLASKPPGKEDASRCLAWIGSLLRRGTAVAVPEIARYEVRRELLRVGATAGLRRMDRLQDSLVYLPLTPGAMDEAALMWAHVRRVCLPTASDDALDGDAILAAQARVVAPQWRSVLIATTNVDHLIRFPGIGPRSWREL